MNDLDYFFGIATSIAGPHLRLIEPEIGGGRIAKTTIDTIGLHPDATIISLSGLTQSTFEYFLRTYGRQFRTINFWKCPLVSDLSMLAEMSQLEYLTYFWNQRAATFWDFQGTPCLKGLRFNDFTRMNDLESLSKAESLEELEFGDKVWVKYKADSLEPIGHLTNLKRLTFTARVISDGRIQPLAKLVALRRLSFPGKLFTTEQVAWLKARLPDTIESNVLCAYQRIERPIRVNDKNKDTFVVGKRKPLLAWDSEKDRILKYTGEFASLVAGFRRDPDLEPADS